MARSLATSVRRFPGHKGVAAPGDRKPSERRDHAKVYAGARRSERPVPFPGHAGFGRSGAEPGAPPGGAG